MIVLFLSILILTSLQSFWLWMKWPIYPPIEQFSTNNGALLILPSYYGVIDSCGMIYTMFSLVPERTGRITQSRTLMNAHCVQVGRKNMNKLAQREEIKSD